VQELQISDRPPREKRENGATTERNESHRQREREKDERGRAIQETRCLQGRQGRWEQNWRGHSGRVSLPMSRDLGKRKTFSPPVVGRMYHSISLRTPAPRSVSTLSWQRRHLATISKFLPGKTFVNIVFPTLDVIEHFMIEV
jgi:hypothetical protein